MEFFRISTGNYVNVANVVRVRITQSDKHPVEIELVTGEKINLDKENGGFVLDAVGKTVERTPVGGRGPSRS